jgi:hypothetical protein
LRKINTGCEPSEIEKPSDDKGGVSPPELEVVQMLDRERPAGPGREKTGVKWTSRIIRPSPIRKNGRNSQEPDKSSPSAIRALSYKLCRSRSPRFALIIRSPPKIYDDVEEIEGFLTIRALFGES